MRTARLLAGLAATVCVLAHAGAARADVSWLCHPGMSADPCEIPLDTTVVAPDGSSTVRTPDRPPSDRRPFDCFYVYPTVSNQLRINATKAPDPEVRAVASYQAARFSSECRMFAPLYRQATTAGVAGALLPPTAAIAYGDVREAWRDYLAHDNGGRGVLLLGHSQGSIMLRELIREEIDPDPVARARLVGAILLGGNVTTRAGRTTGGDFAHVPICTRAGEDGCVVAFSTSSTDPAPLAFFGNTDTDGLGAGFGLPHGPGYEVACTDPGPLSGVTGPVGVEVPTTPYPAGFIAAGIAVTANGPIPSAPTSWVQAFAYEGRCATINGAHVYRYHPVDGSRTLNEFPPAWGTHLLDFNLGADRLTALAARQAQTWLGDGLAVGRPVVPRAPGSGRVTVTAPGAGTVRLSARGVLRVRSATVTAPGAVTLRIVPTARTARAVARGRARRARARVTYTPTGGDPIVRTVVLRLRPR